MGMPPPINDDPVDPEDSSYFDKASRIDLREIGRKLKENDIGNLIFSLGAGIVAFNEARKRRKTGKGDDEWVR